MEDRNRRYEWEDLERLDWQLWIFSGVLIVILGLSLLSFMFPEAFWQAGTLGDSVQRKAVVGFAVLLVLVLLYMFQRQATICRLKRELFEARQENLEAQRKSYLSFLLTLPTRTHFRDALAMEFRRTSRAGASLSQVLIRLQDVSPEDMGRMGVFVRSLLRGEELIARISESTIGLILPEMPRDAATALAGRIGDYLKVELPEARLETCVISYPQDAGSLSELENPLRILESTGEWPEPCEIAAR